MMDNGLFALAELVATVARSLQIETALIGAGALAIHGYVRATLDVDLACAVDPFAQLPRLQEALESRGLKTQLNLPDDEDSLGGMLRVWEHEDADYNPIGSIDVVNFFHPHRPLRLPVHELIRDSIQSEENPAFRYVRLPHLVLLKLYAGGRSDHGDVVQLLERNPDADVEDIRQLCKRYGLGMIDTLIAEAEHNRNQRRST